MRRLAPWLTVCALLGGLAVRGEIIDRIAVSVGKHVITTTNLDREIRVNAFLNESPPDFSPAGKRATATRMVEQALVRDELEDSRYPTPALSEVDPVLAQLKKDRYANDADFERALTTAGISAQDLRDELLWQRTLLEFLDERFRSTSQLSDQAVQDYFEKTVLPAARAAHPNETPTLDDYRDQIEATLMAKQEDEEMNHWLDRAKARIQIVYHDEVFQ